jgi:hypothetical protein
MLRILRHPTAALLSCVCAAFLCAASLAPSVVGQTPPTAVIGADDRVAAPATDPSDNDRPSPVSAAGISALLPKDLSPWGMFLSADIVVKLVMIGLAFASVVTWTVALAKGLEVRWANRRMRRITAQHTTNLAVVAPGIAEALLATALGLVVAIPAVVIYNAFSRSIAAHRGFCADSTAEVLRLASRDLDRNFSQATPKVEGARPVVLRQRP